MPNWCINNVLFTASKQNLRALGKLFCAMRREQKHTLCGQLPSFIQVGSGAFFDIDWSADGSLHYETRWTPNTNILVQIADKYNASFVHAYEETGNGIYGEARYENGILTDIGIGLNEIMQYQYLEDNDQWLFEGKLYDSDIEILDILLERKKTNFINNQILSL